MDHYVIFFHKGFDDLSNFGTGEYYIAFSREEADETLKNLRARKFIFQISMYKLGNKIDIE